jgi:hypothetical protein
MIKIISTKKLKGGKKKYEIIFEKNGKRYIRKFGSQGMSDYTIHKDKSRRERYISRHKRDLRTNDPMRPGYLSMYILWNKPTFKASLADYKRRLGIYNRTGKFPTNISGSKKLSFGQATLVYPWGIKQEHCFDIDEIDPSTREIVRDIKIEEVKFMKEYLNRDSTKSLLFVYIAEMTKKHPDLFGRDRDSEYDVTPRVLGSTRATISRQKTQADLSRSGMELATRYYAMLTRIADEKGGGGRGSKYKGVPNNIKSGVNFKNIVHLNNINFNAEESTTRVDTDTTCDHETPAKIYKWYTGFKEPKTKNLVISSALDIEINKHLHEFPGDLKFKVIDSEFSKWALNKGMPVMGGQSATFYRIFNMHSQLLQTIPPSPELILAYLVAGANHSIIEVSLSAALFGRLLLGKIIVQRNTYNLWKKMYFSEKKFINPLGGYKIPTPVSFPTKRVTFSQDLPSSKKQAKFGGIIPVSGTRFDILPEELVYNIQTQASASEIQESYKSYAQKRAYLKKLLYKYWDDYGQIYPSIHRNIDNRELRPWLILKPMMTYTTQWLEKAANILTANDLKKDSFWYYALRHVLITFKEARLHPRLLPHHNLRYDNYNSAEQSIDIMLRKIGYTTFISNNQNLNYTQALNWLDNEYGTANAFGSKSKFGGMKSLHFYKQIIKIKNPDVSIVAKNLLDELSKRCKGDLLTERCKIILADLLFNIFYSLVNPKYKTDARKEILTKVNTMKKHYINNTNPDYEFTKFKITGSQINTLGPLIHMFQDEHQGTLNEYSFLATYILMYINNIKP